MTGGERCVELAEVVPLLGDEAEVHRPPAALEKRLKDAVVAGRVGAIDTLAVQAANARAEAHADHREGGEVDLGVAVGVARTSSRDTTSTVADRASPSRIA